MKSNQKELRHDQHEAFANDGFIVINDLLSSEEIAETKSAFSRIVRTYGPDRSLAEIEESSGTDSVLRTVIKKHDSSMFFQLEPGKKAETNDMDALELQVRKFMSFEHEDSVFINMLSESSRMFRIVSELIADHPLLFQSMALVKPPKIGSTKPWHQDNAYFSVSPLESVCGVWIAVDEATVKNGCMHMLKGEHHKGPLKHEHRRDCEINVRSLDLKTLVPVPLKPGGALFFSGMVPHETPPNRSEQRRRALQFHFRGSRSEIIPGPDYDKLFRDSEGIPASCAAIRKQGV